MCRCSDTLYYQAIDSQMYDGGKWCGKYVIITRISTGKSVKALVADECPTCASAQSLDLSTGAFNQLGTADEGVCTSPGGSARSLCPPG